MFEHSLVNSNDSSVANNSFVDGFGPVKRCLVPFLNYFSYIPER